MILIIDDDQSVTHSLALLLKQAGYESRAVGSPAEALAALEREPVDLVLQDMNFSRRTTGEEGLELLRQIKARRAAVPVILITGWGSIALAVAGMKAGGSDFIVKPWSNQQLLQSVRTALGLAASNAAPAGDLPLRDRAELDRSYDFAGLVGRDPKFVQVLQLAGRVSATDASVLITGESGTGKELVAAAIHRNSRRKDGPFVKVNLGGLPATLFEGEMFGHAKGAFTGAQLDRRGRFESANGGTILLDEIGELELSLQVKLLRVLQDRTYEVLGSSTTRTLDIRVISATNRDLKAAVEAGDFREDLLYRLNLITLHLPPLRERSSDIPLHAGHFLAQAAASYGRPELALSAEALPWLAAADWPGNARQLHHLIERTVLITDRSLIGPAELELAYRMEASETGAGAERLPAVGSMTLEAVERAMIERSLGFHRGNVSRVAESLGMTRQAVYRRIDRLGIKLGDRPGGRGQAGREREPDGEHAEDEA
ncbi:MAG TPA: sigma-54 dependent transcriptional regulator [Candidatus Udaeobacter sp.]|nr:sigma-54 dependent transcriptional regulator [Candidatus Udaeobacter sp.]